MQDFEELFQIMPWEHFTKHVYQNEECAKIAALYTNHLYRLHSVSLIPGHAFMDGEKWRESCLRASDEFGRVDLTDPRIPARAKEHYDTWRWNSDIADKRAHFLEASKNAAAMWSGTMPMHIALYDLVLTLIVQAWTAFEVMADHLWRALDKLRPQLFASLSNTKKKGFGFRSRKAIRRSYEMTLQEDNFAVTAAMNSSAIDALALIRCLIVHAAGKVDQWFLDDSKDALGNPVSEVAQYLALPIGTPIEIPCGYARKLIDNVTPISFDLISEVDKWIVRHP